MMKIFLIVILTSVFVVVAMFLLNAASFDGVTKNNVKNDEKDKIFLKKEDKI